VQQTSSWILIGLAVLAALILALLTGGVMMGPGMMGWGGYGFGWWGVLMFIGMLLFWGLIIGGIVWLVTSISRQGQPAGVPGGANRALEILKERYARGEITREQYEQMRHDLGE
jgi:putative membrane protein